MAIQQRRGANADFDSTKMLPGELAVTTDGTRKVYAAFAPGDVKELASAEEVQESVQKGIEEIKQKKDEVLAQFPNYEDKIKELEVYKANSIIQTSSGQVIHETDCAAVPPINIKLFGKGKQDTRALKLLGRTISSDTNYSNTSRRTFDGNTIFVGISSDNYLSSDNISSYTINESSVTTNTLNAGYGIGFDVEVYEGEEYLLGYDVNNDSCAGLTFYDKEGNYISYVFNIKDTNVVVPSGARWMVVIFPSSLGSAATYTNINLTLVNDTIPNMKHKREVEFLGESGSIGGKVCNANLLSDQNIIDFGFSKVGENEFYTQNSSTAYLKVLFKNTYGYKGQIKLSGLIKYINPNNVVGALLKVVYTDGTYKWLENFSKFNEYQEISFVSDNGKVVDSICCDSYGTGSTETYLKNMQVSFDTTVPFTPYSEQPFTALTPNGLRGVPLGQTIPDAIKNSPIHMSGVYWDTKEGQYYIADTKNEDGKDVQRIVDYVVDGSNDWHLYNVDYEGFACAILPSNARRKSGYCNELRVIDEYTNDNYGSKFSDSIWIGVDSVYIYLVYNSFFDATLEDYGLANLKAHLNENPLKIWTWLDEPIITDTTEEEKAQLDNLVMNYPNTTIVNDAGAYMEVTHVKDTQQHIEQNYVSKAMYEEHESRIAELEKAIVNS